jgi:hypothetical protein
MSTCLLIEPLVTGKAMLCGMSAGKQRGMAHSGKGIGMAIVGIGIYHTIVHQVSESGLCKTLAQALREVTSQLVHCDLQDELDIVGIGCRTSKKGQGYEGGG